MTWQVWVEIVCFSCASTIAGQHCVEVPRGEMKAQAIKAGWKLYNEEWHCKRCING